MNFQAIRANPWPYAIIGWFLLFGSGMAAWLMVAVRNDPELVRADYYDQEIAYQKQIDRLNRTAGVQSEVSVSYESAQQQIALRLPAAHVGGKPLGSIRFYRPSNAKLDFELPLALDAMGAQRIPPADSRAGCGKCARIGPAAARNSFTTSRSCSK